MNFHFNWRCGVALSAFGLCVLPFASRAQTRPKLVMVAEINGYTNWLEVTQRPVEMDPSVAVACAPPNFFSHPSLPTIRGTQGPHRKKFIRVFVNPVGAAEMMTRRAPRFPVGSVIVKQKLALETQIRKGSKAKSQVVGSRPELLTVMIKRKKGYDAANGDWEYLVTDGTGKQVAGRGQLQACQNCHRPFQKTDYIVRSYLPPDVVKALRDADMN